MKKNVFGILKNVLSDNRLTAFDKNVFSCLLTYNGKGRIFPSRKDIMNRLNSRNLPTISKSVKNLQNAGYITVVRRKQQSNIYHLNNIESKMKIKQDFKKPKDEKESKDESIKYMDKAMIEIVAGEVAKANDRIKVESSDFSFVNKLLKLKISDKYKDDCFNTVRKCLMLLYLINIHKDKFKNEIPYPYFQTVYSTSNYSNLSKKIFNSRSIIQTVKFKTGNQNSYM